MDPRITDAGETFEKRFEAAMMRITRRALPLQRRTFSCADRCFAHIPTDESVDLAPEDLEKMDNCVKKCEAPSRQFSDLLNHEMRSLQGEISSCHQRCAPPAKPEGIDCIVKCFSQALPDITNFETRMLDLARKQLESSDD